MPESASTRTTYQLDGRRVTVADLLQAGLLQEGEPLTFERPRIGKTYSALVTDRGWIQLMDGREFRSPSRAAAAAVGTGTFDGWHAWALSDGQTLDQLRQRFLDAAAEGSAQEPQDDGVTTTVRARHQRLKNAREQAEAGNPESLTVSDLLGWWGVQRRGSLITQQIRAELDNHSLLTSPAFDKVPIDATVHLVVPPSNDVPTIDESDAVASVVDTAGSEDERPEVGLPVGSLHSALAGVDSLPPSATFEQAITMMAINDYSQIPILEGPRKLRGAVTWKSIAKTRHVSPEAKLSDAVVDASVVSYSLDLIDILPLLEESEFVLVKDETNKIAGIVTASDVAGAYGSMATPFFLVGELDQRLRQVIADSFEMKQVIEWCDADNSRGITCFDDLSFGDYLWVLRNPKAWELLGWPLDRKIFTDRLDEIREIRNDLMHFNPDPLPDDAVQKIRYAINLVRECAESAR
ncbi:CBS domain-containing protein [Streptomyces althioticus]|uniref:restriction system modified-DNA reader domain-containing protein n=1 Tax=Streptomyces althioticus TaxID=83380 RepID=UPI0036E698E5